MSLAEKNCNMKKIKSNIGKIFIGMLLITLFAPNSLIAQENSQPYIVMNASSERQVTPNELYLSITIKESDYKGKKSLEELQAAMISVLRAYKIDAAEALTLDFMGSSVSYKLFRSMVPKTQANYKLKLPDVGKMQKIVSALESVGISNIELTDMKYTNSDELITELGAEALKKAQQRAQAYAAAIGQNIGKALSISSYNSEAVQPRIYKSRAMLAVEDSAENASLAPQSSISAGKLTYRVEVTVRFLLQ